jgi:uncharacterized membrane protein
VIIGLKTILYHLKIEGVVIWVPTHRAKLYKKTLAATCSSVYIIVNLIFLSIIFYPMHNRRFLKKLLTTTCHVYVIVISKKNYERYLV